jgi:site-specific DNA-methyltransferase (adenine-specific)
LPRLVSNTTEQLIFIEPEPIGKIIEKNPTSSVSKIYEHKNGSLFEGDSIEWLQSLESQSVDLIFADPPYNIKKRIGTNLNLRKPISIGQFSG